MHKNSALKDYLKVQTFKREKGVCSSQATSSHNDKTKLTKAGTPNSAGVIANANAELVLWLVGVEEPAITSKKY